MRVTNPHQIYSQIWNSLSNELVSPNLAVVVLIIIYIRN